MKDCPKCGNAYPDPFEFCPVDGIPLPDESAGQKPPSHRPPAAPEGPASITVRTLILAIFTLFLVAVLAFASVFLYQYSKPKYGGLIVKTSPAGAKILIDGRERGVTPLTVGDIRSGGHEVRAQKEGYKEYIQKLEVMPYATESFHWSLEPLVSQLSNEQLADVEELRKKLDAAYKENILLPPPEDYNVLHFANRILAIDPANSYALEVKAKLADNLRQLADLAYAREDLLEAEKQYKNLALLFPDDISINERLTDIAAKIDASVKDREQQITDWKTKAEAALGNGSLLPPAKDNALEAIRTIQRLDRKNDFARRALLQLKDALQNRGDVKFTAGDWLGAQNEFKQLLSYFPDDPYSKSRLSVIEGKVAEQAQSEQQRLLRLQQRQQEEQQTRQKTANLRQSALTSFRAGAFQKSMADWQEYLKMEPSSDEAYFYIGSINMEQKQLDTAILSFEKSVSLNPGNASAHMNLGILYDRHRNDFARALEHLKKVKELGGAEKYSPDRVQAMIQEIQDRGSLETLHKVPFPVEHRHAFSSCRGTLRITDEGVEFKTTETDHSFYEPFNGLRGFSVKGEELSIRMQGTKKYNFRLLNPEDGARIRRLAARHTPITD
jgi:tetratricopeptide (TPR) repeat protein